MFAHGHFCVLPKSDKEVYSSIIKEIQKKLTENNWHDLPKYTYECNKFFPNFEEIADFYNVKLRNMPPYILCSHIVDEKAPEIATVFLQKDSDSRTPSQLLRQIIAKYVFGSTDTKYWDWKPLLEKFQKGQDISDYKPHINELKRFDDLFEKKLSLIV